MSSIGRVKVLSQTVLTILLVIYLCLWIVDQFFSSEILHITWGVSYWLFAFFGSLAGYFIAKKWGGLKSILGKAIYSFSLGLFLHSVGQNLTNYYILKDILTYPSWADVSFFLSVPFYLYGSLLLMKLTGVRTELQYSRNKIIGILVFLTMLSLSYFFLISGVRYDFSDILLLFIDFGYPLGETLFVSAALTTFLLSRKILGGRLRKPMLLFLFALLMQYLADFIFIILLGNNAWIAGSYNDLMYLVAYFLMSYAILEMYKSFFQIQRS